MCLGEQEGQGLLHDYLFHGLKKKPQNPLCYLYDNTKIDYAQLMAAAQKAKPESEDSKPSKGIKVQFCSTEGKKGQNKVIEQLKQQIRAFMAAIEKENKPKEQVKGKRKGPFQKNGNQNKDIGGHPDPGKVRGSLFNVSTVRDGVT